MLFRVVEFVAFVVAVAWYVDTPSYEALLAILTAISILMATFASGRSGIYETVYSILRLPAFALFGGLTLGIWPAILLLIVLETFGIEPRRILVEIVLASSCGIGLWWGAWISFKEIEVKRSLFFKRILFYGVLFGAYGCLVSAPLSMRSALEVAAIGGLCFLLGAAATAMYMVVLFDFDVP